LRGENVEVVRVQDDPLVRLRVDRLPEFGGIVMILQVDVDQSGVLARLEADRATIARQLSGAAEVDREGETVGDVRLGGIAVDEADAAVQAPRSAVAGGGGAAAEAELVQPRAGA